MRNAGLEEAQTRIKTAGRNIRYADNTDLIEESEEELKGLLVKMKQWKHWLKSQHSEN